MRALSMVLNAVSEDNDVSLIINITNELIDKYKQLTLNKQRYYGDSHHHRYKNRILQALLVFESVLVQSNAVEAEVCILCYYHLYDKISYSSRNLIEPWLLEIFKTTRMIKMVEWSAILYLLVPPLCICKRRFKNSCYLFLL